MKRILLLLALGAFLSVPAFAQSQGSAGTSTQTAPKHDGPPVGRHMDGLTPEEHHELMAAHQAAMQANPDLEQEQKALQDKINAAMIKADPNVAPIIAKMEAARQKHHDEQGGADGTASKPLPAPGT